MIYHLTSQKRLNNILKEGLKINSHSNLTTQGGELNMMFYPHKGIYCLIQNTGSIFHNETDYTLSIDLPEDDLVSDIQSLVDYGAYIDYESKTLSFKNRFIPESNYFNRGHSVFMDELLDIEHPACHAAKKLTNSGVYMADIAPELIKENIRHNHTIHSFINDKILNNSEKKTKNKLLKL